MIANIAERFFALVDMDGPVPLHRPELGQCHVWTGTINSKGNYGVVSRIHGLPGVEGRRVVSAHRLSFFLAHGRWPDPCCLHACDNPPCVRPSHLFEGTRRDNNMDAIAKGRMKFPPRPIRGITPLHVPSGTDHYIAKLTADDVREIRRAFSSGTKGVDLAARYRVTSAAISNAVHRKTYRNVT